MKNREAGESKTDTIIQNKFSKLNTLLEEEKQFRQKMFNKLESTVKKDVNNLYQRIQNEEAQRYGNISDK